jgi:hypothetical protein
MNIHDHLVAGCALLPLSARPHPTLIRCTLLRLAVQCPRVAGISQRREVDTGHSDVAHREYAAAVHWWRANAGEEVG